jgi:hypothetical protein
MTSTNPSTVKSYFFDVLPFTLGTVMSMSKPMLQIEEQIKTILLLVAKLAYSRVLESSCRLLDHTKFRYRLDVPASSSSRCSFDLSQQRLCITAFP